MHKVINDDVPSNDIINENISMNEIYNPICYKCLSLEDLVHEVRYSVNIFDGIKTGYRDHQFNCLKCGSYWWIYGEKYE